MSNETEAEKNIIFDAQAALPDKYTNRNSTFTAANLVGDTPTNAELGIVLHKKEQ